MYELSEIMRQREDTSYAELLNRLREGNQTEKDINALKKKELFQKLTLIILMMLPICFLQMLR